MSSIAGYIVIASHSVREGSAALVAVVRGVERGHYAPFETPRFVRMAWLASSTKGLVTFAVGNHQLLFPIIRTDVEATDTATGSRLS